MKNYQFTPSTEQMVYDLVDHNIHMMAMFEILSIVRAEVRKQYDRKDHEAIELEWLTLCRPDYLPETP